MQTLRLFFALNVIWLIFLTDIFYSFFIQIIYITKFFLWNDFVCLHNNCIKKLEAPRSLYSSPGYNNNISQ